MLPPMPSMTLAFSFSQDAMLPPSGAVPASCIISLPTVTFQAQDRLCKACKLMDNWRPYVMATRASAAPVIHEFAPFTQPRLLILRLRQRQNPESIHETGIRHICRKTKNGRNLPLYIRIRRNFTAENQIFFVHCSEFDFDRVLRAAHHSRRRKVQRGFCCTWRRAEPVSEANGSAALGVGRRSALAADAWQESDANCRGPGGCQSPGDSTTSGACRHRQDKLSTSGRQGAHGKLGNGAPSWRRGPQKPGVCAGQIAERSGVQGGLSFRGRCRRRGRSPWKGVRRSTHPVPGSARWPAGY